jgi:hypothetical protein
VSTTELRIYRIEDGRLDEFLAAWTAGVVPLRRKFGFSIEAWTVPGENTVVWMLTYRGEGTFVAAEQAYYASSERRTLDPDPAQYIASMEKRWLEPLALPAGGTSSRHGMPRDG